MAQTYLQALASDARCFSCLNRLTQTQVQAYIAAFSTGLGVDPAAWAIRVKCLNCLTRPQLLQARVYLLAVIAGFTTDAASLVAAAKCFTCFDQGEISTIQTYLLAQDPTGPGITDPKALAQVVSGFRKFNSKTLLQIEVFSLATNAGVSINSSSIAAAAKCMPCVPEPLLAAVALQALDFLEPIPSTSERNIITPPPPPPPPPGGGTHRGGGVGACTDTLANLTPVVTAHYVAGAITTIDLLVPRTCCKNGHYQVYGSNASDMTGAVLVTTGNEPNRTGNWTITGIDVSGAGFTYYAAKTVCTGGLTSPFSNIVLSVDGSSQANDWAARVVTNGGAMPSQNSINACETFVESLMVAGIWTKMVAVNMVAPDSLTAALTPLVKNAGIDPWTQFNGTDITINGIRLTAANGFINTGVIPSNNPFPAFSYGLVAYNFDAFTAAAQYSLGTAVAFSFALGHTGANEWDLEMPFSDVQLLVAGAANWKGYSSGQRIANNDLKCYRASSGTAWAQVGTSATVVNDRRGVVTVAFYALAENANGAAAGQTNMRHSFFAITQGLTSTQDHALFDAVQALRTTFGGGFV